MAKTAVAICMYIPLYYQRTIEIIAGISILEWRPAGAPWRFRLSVRVGGLSAKLEPPVPAAGEAWLITPSFFLLNPFAKLTPSLAMS